MMSKLSLALSCLVLASTPASAQAPPKPPAAAAPAPTACPPNTATVHPPGSNAPGATTGESRQPLGDKLAESGGVLCPPAGIDPEIRAPTPDVGKTPVIPPPGTPGGDPTIRPK
ncbi:hypothetical protein FLL57_02795 [Rhodopseudomonas palustris]|uniref:hypothetical protein n=1 Tax=Rhodopseudomonas palustris TaxID=1076 RepID=UPI00115D59A4|nr:hypothetical protein [Rhodopseudomonas palustris]QDL96295.1 hypothetical protein FLL57_02795 [Rhodopseudomonas palustris]